MNNYESFSFGIPLGRYTRAVELKINDPVKILFRRKMINAKVYKIGIGCIDARANGLYYFCQNCDYAGVWQNVRITKAYNRK